MLALFDVSLVEIKADFWTCCEGALGLEVEACTAAPFAITSSLHLCSDGHAVLLHTGCTLTELTSPINDIMGETGAGWV